MKRFFVIGLGMLLAVFFYGCASSNQDIPEVTAKMATQSGVDQVTLARGRGLYMAHCATCHERVKPGEIDPEFWRSVTHHMAVKAKLSATEEKQVLQYVMVAHAELHGLHEE